MNREYILSVNAKCTAYHRRIDHRCLTAISSDGSQIVHRTGYTQTMYISGESLYRHIPSQCDIINIDIIATFQIIVTDTLVIYLARRCISEYIIIGEAGQIIIGIGCSVVYLVSEDRKSTRLNPVTR